MPAQHNNPNTLEGIAADLRTLADDLAKGQLRVGNRLVAIGDPLFIKTKQKITGDTAYCTLSFQVPMRDSDKEAIFPNDQRPPLEKISGSRYDKELRLKGRPPEGKKIKKQMSSLWKTISRKLEQGQPPTAAEEKALISAFENYTVFAEPAWHEAWLACFSTMREALACARRGEMRKALELAGEVNDRTKACHKNHK